MVNIDVPIQILTKKLLSRKFEVSGFLMTEYLVNATRFIVKMENKLDMIDKIEVQ